MPRFMEPSIHAVASVEATSRSVMITDTGHSFCSVTLSFNGNGDDAQLTIYLPAERAGYARELADAMNAVLAKHKAKMPEAA